MGPNEPTHSAALYSQLGVRLSLWIIGAKSPNTEQPFCLGFVDNRSLQAVNECEVFGEVSLFPTTLEVSQCPASRNPLTHRTNQIRATPEVRAKAMRLNDASGVNKSPIMPRMQERTAAVKIHLKALLFVLPLFPFLSGSSATPSGSAGAAARSKGFVAEDVTSPVFSAFSTELSALTPASGGGFVGKDKAGGVRSSSSLGAGGAELVGGGVAAPVVSTSVAHGRGGLPVFSEFSTDLAVDDAAEA
jgi:hypothetical protein